jgi:hypothetical protein
MNPTPINEVVVSDRNTTNCLNDFNELNKEKIMLKIRFFLNEPNGKP